MAKQGFCLFASVVCVAILVLADTLCSTTDEDRKVYIVYMGSLTETYSLSAADHMSILQQVVDPSFASSHLLRSYTRSFNGFAAKLSDSEVKKIHDMKQVISIFPSISYELHTTRSWDFMGLNKKTIRRPSVESNTIIGVLDTGIWPESKSFSDTGYGRPPRKWKGACKGGQNFTCNNKLVGARFYLGNSARDEMGHGSHTASTAAGNEVVGASFYGLKQGIARGGVPSARIAAYRVCDDEGCSADAILAAFDDAIADGVDVITISLGPEQISPRYYETDAIAIGSFHALRKGILTVQSAGNKGPLKPTPSVAPWILTVAASNIDRKFITRLVLGNGSTIVGNSINSFKSMTQDATLVYGKDAAMDPNMPDPAKRCVQGSLDETKVKGKIVLCDEPRGALEAFFSGSAGAIMMRNPGSTVSYVTPLPALSINNNDYIKVISYLQNTKKAEGHILKSEVLRTPSAPIVAPFSSRGPNFLDFNISKPDVTAPGVEIIAAYSPVATIGAVDDGRRANYAILSGTSMSCPHAAAAAAFVKTFHPSWSPSFIKSALMTTAQPMNARSSNAREFGYGSGHINPLKAIDPGLVYPFSPEDYMKLLCRSVLNVRQMTGDNTDCPSDAKRTPPEEYNFPSLTVRVLPGRPFTVIFKRTVLNVGFANSTYSARIVSGDSRLMINVNPKVLSFKTLNESKTFTVKVTGGVLRTPNIGLFSSLVWSDGKHVVRSPIIVHTTLRPL